MNNSFLPECGLRLLRQAKPREFRLAVKCLPLLGRLQTALILAQENAKPGAAGRLLEKAEKALRDRKTKTDRRQRRMSEEERFAEAHVTIGKYLKKELKKAASIEIEEKKFGMILIEQHLLRGERQEAFYLAKAFGLSDIAKKLGKLEAKGMILADSKEEVCAFARGCGISESELSEIALEAAIERIRRGKPHQAQEIACAYLLHNDALQK